MIKVYKYDPPGKYVFYTFMYDEDKYKVSLIESRTDGNDATTRKFEVAEDLFYKDNKDDVYDGPIPSNVEQSVIKTIFKVEL